MAKIIENRLKIKTVKEESQIGGRPNIHYIAYFVDISTLSLGGENGVFGIKNEVQRFDIRNSFRYSLLVPEVILPESESLP